VAVLVIDAFEVVNVDTDHHKRFAITLRAYPLQLQPVLHGAAVVQAGELVLAGLAAQRAHQARTHQKQKQVVERGRGNQRGDPGIFGGTAANVKTGAGLRLDQKERIQANQC
jgi:hypothetical protein